MLFHLLVLDCNRAVSHVVSGRPSCSEAVLFISVGGVAAIADVLKIPEPTVFDLLASHLVHRLLRSELDDGYRLDGGFSYVYRRSSKGLVGFSNGVVYQGHWALREFAE